MVAYLDDTDTPQYYDGSAWLAMATEDYVDTEIAGIPVIAGIGSNVVQTVKTDTFTTSSGSFVDVTGLTVTITPTSATSKIYIAFTLPMTFVSGSVDRSGQFSLFRGSTNLVVPDSPGGRTAALSGVNINGLTRASSQLPLHSGQFLDSPATTSATTYSVRVRSSDSATLVYVNRTSGDVDNAGSERAIATITAIEVAA